VKLRWLVLSAVILMLWSSSTVGQTSGTRRGWAYGYGGFGGTSSARSFHIGGGGEMMVAAGFGVGLDAGHFSSTAQHVDNSLNIVSADASYHFGARNSARKLIPFATGGVSLGNGRSGGANFGGGIQYWLRERLALRLEFREHLFSSDTPVIYGIHFGLAFR
jgi:hypothetical protein